jgi:saccharopine dehydrogenase-like NADP-dependent oxidoreductase
MKNILILGAGQSAPYLIKYLLDEAQKNDWTVTLCDRDEELANQRINGHPNGKAVKFDVNDETTRHEQIKNADVVVNFLAPYISILISVGLSYIRKTCCNRIIRKSTGGRSA